MRQCDIHSWHPNYLYHMEFPIVPTIVIESFSPQRSVCSVELVNSDDDRFTRAALWTMHARRSSRSDGWFKARNRGPTAYPTTIDAAKIKERLAYVYCSPDRCDDTITRAESTVAHAAAACMYSPHSALRVKRSSSLLTSSTEQTDRCGENDSIIIY